jgi:sortase A
MIKIQQFFRTNIPDNKKLIRVFIVVFEGLSIGIFIYLITLPFYPSVIYDLTQDNPQTAAAARDVEAVKEQAAEIKNHLPETDYAVSPNRLIITKIGVNAPIVEAKTADVGLSKGAWRMPDSSTPDKGGNMILTGHRFKYLPPNNLTFFLFDKLEPGDIAYVIWEGKDYLYRIRETKVVEPTDLSVLAESDKPILTMFTCTPIYSTRERLVVVADLIEDEEVNSGDMAE